MPSPDLTGLYSRIPRPVRQEIPRPPLLGKLQASEGPLVALLAPGGYGKTTLLAQFARSVPGRAIWLSLREEEADPLRLCGRIGEALTRVLPTLSLERFQQAQEAGRPALALASALAADLARSTTNLEFVLDGADHLGDASGRWLGAWLDELPEGHRVFVSARTAPPLGLARRIAAATAVSFGVDDLAFSAEETEACLRDAPATVNRAAVHTRLEGWPIGVNLAASGAETHFSVRNVLSDALRQLPADVLAGLPELSVLDVWTEKQVLDLGLRVPAGWLEAVRAAGLPLTPILDAARPHALLRDWLEELLRRDERRHAQLHLLAAEQAEAQGQEWQALEHYRLARAQEAQLRLVTTLALRYQERWEPRLLVQVLDTLPPALRTDELSIMLGKARIDSGDVKGGSALIRDLHRQGVRRPDVFFVLGAVAARAGEDEELLRLAEEGLSCPHTAKEACRLLRLKAAALHHLEQPGAMTAAQAALSLARDDQDLIETGAVLDIVQMIHKSRGEWPECEAALRTALRIYTDAAMPSRALMLQNNLADLLLLQGRYSEALDLISAALPVAERERSVVLGLLLGTQGEIQGRRRRYAEARDAFERALALYEEFEIAALISQVWPALTEAALRCADLSSIRQRIAQWALTAPPTVHAQQALSLCRGLLAFHAGQWADAAAAFAQVTAGDHQVRARLLGASSACRDGSFGAAQARQVQAALAQARPHQLSPDDAPELLLVMQACLQWGVTLDSGPALLEQLTSPPRSESGRDAAPALQVQTLGQVSVTVDGEPIHVPLSRSVEVLVWLALHREGTRDQIMNDLWEGSNEQRHIEYFKVAVRHLRLALAAHPSVTFNPLPYQQGRYRLAPEFQVELDALLPSRLLNQPTEEGLRRVIDAYRGPFLPASESAWVEVRRMELLEQTLSAALMLAQRLQAEHPDQAAAVLERGVEIDPLQEEAHLRLIELWDSRAEPGAARRCYARYSRMLAEEWQRQPTSELQARFRPV